MSAYFLPIDNMVYDIDYKNSKIQYSIKNKKLSDTAFKKYILLSIKHDTLEPLINFIHAINEEYDKEIEKKNWQQMLYTPEKVNTEITWKGSISHNKKNIDTVILAKGTKELLINDLQNFFESEEWYKSMGLSWNRSYLIFGPPGTGKSSIIKAISSTYSLDIYNLQLNKVLNDEDLKKLFDQIPSKSLLVLEDIDAMTNIVYKRTSVEDTEKQKEVDNNKVFMNCGITLSCLLNLLDGVNNSWGRVMIMTTNHKEKLDPALIRSGRCDLQLHLSYCSQYQIQELYKLYFRKEIPSLQLCNIPDNKYSPADIAGLFLRYRLDHAKALETLTKLDDALQTMKY